MDKEKQEKNGWTRNFLLIQWLLFIMLIFFSLYSTGINEIKNLYGLIAVIVCLAVCNILFSFKPLIFLKNKLGINVIFLIDITAISLTVFFTRGIDSDLYLAYFLIIFISALSSNVIRSIVITTVISIVYIGLLLKNKQYISLLEPSILIRIPFFYVTSFFCSFLTEQLHLEIVKRKDVEKSLSASEEILKKEKEKMKMYLDIAANIFLVLDVNGNVTLINKKGCEVLECKEEDILNKNWFDNYISPETREESKSIFLNLIAGKIDMAEYSENTVLSKSGKKKNILWHNTVVEDGKDKITAVLSSGEDLTERKELEKQFFHAQKMESIGRFASSIAHDFNNILTTISGYAALAKNEINPGSPAYEDIGQVIKATSSATNLVGQLLAFSRRQVILPKVMNLNELVSNMNTIIRRLTGENIEIIIKPGEEIGMIKADSSQIEQILINLVVNARDAMPKGGALTIETANVTLDRNYTVQHIGVVPGEFIMMSVSDTGGGMSEEAKAHIFEPFFTTKEEGKGTGFGLSTVYGIVKQHQGTIWVYSELNKGTTFKIYFPRVDEKAQRLIKTENDEQLSSGNESILIVEDNESVRQLAVRILGGLGYNILEANDGEEALSVAKQHKGDIHLLLSDVVMPKMESKELVEKLKLISPMIKIIFTSGYTDDVIAQHAVLEKDSAFLQKPFTASTLANKVREMLDRK